VATGFLYEGCEPTCVYPDASLVVGLGEHRFLLNLFSSSAARCCRDRREALPCSSGIAMKPVRLKDGLIAFSFHG